MASMTKEEMLKIAGVKPLIERVQFGAMPTDPRQMEGELELIIKQLTAARRGLGMANKLSPGSRERHKSMVMSNLNVIRNRYNKLVDAFGKESEHITAAPAPAPEQGEV